MRPHDSVTAPAAATATAAAPTAGPVDVDQAEAALVEHYPRLVRIAYLVLPPSLGRNRRVLTAHALVQRSLPRGRTATVDGVLPGPRRADGGGGPGGARNPGYTYVRARVLRQALDAGRPLLRLARPRRAQLPPVLPRVWGLRLFPRSGGADELALDQRLSALSGPARAAFVLRGLEGLADADVERTLGAAGADDPAGALARAVAAETPESGALLRSAEFDPCSLQARPTDLMRRRQHAKAALAATAALLVCAAFLGLPGDGWGPGGAAAPSYARNPMAQAALDPAKVRRVAPAFWEGSARTDFSAWPTRGALAGDTGLLRRALAVWARPGRTVQVSATPGTPSGPPMGSPQLLYAGRVDAVRVVLLYDGLRVVRYAEATDGGGAAGLDFARVDGADGSASGALVLARSDSDVRFLTAPWVTRTSVRDLRDPEAPARPLGRDADGVTDPMDSPATARDCGSWDTLDVRDGSHDRLLTDLGELTPARLTSGPPSSPSDVSSAQDRVVWARTACLLPTVRSHGVRSVNSWAFARQTLPEANGTAEWLCTRAETWRGTGSRVLAQFQPPSATKPAPAGAIAARAEDSPACGAREPRAVLAGVLWKSRGGQWYVLAAGSEEFRSLTVSGGVKGTAKGRMLAVRASAGARAELKGAVEGGGSVGALR